MRGRDTGNLMDDTAVRIILTGGAPPRMVAPPRPRPRPPRNVPRPRPTGNRGPRVRTVGAACGERSGHARPEPSLVLFCANGEDTDGAGSASRRAADGRCSDRT